MTPDTDYGSTPPNPCPPREAYGIEFAESFTDQGVKLEVAHRDIANAWTRLSLALQDLHSTIQATRKSCKHRFLAIAADSKMHSLSLPVCVICGSVLNTIKADVALSSGSGGTPHLLTVTPEELATLRAEPMNNLIEKMVALRDDVQKDPWE